MQINLKWQKADQWLPADEMGEAGRDDRGAQETLRLVIIIIVIVGMASGVLSSKLTKLHTSSMYSLVHWSQ